MCYARQELIFTTTRDILLWGRGVSVLTQGQPSKTYLIAFVRRLLIIKDVLLIEQIIFSAIYNMIINTYLPSKAIKISYNESGPWGEQACSGTL
jgi:hypothetical protein